MRRVCGNRGYSPAPALQMRAQPESTLGGSDDGSYAGAGPGHAVTIDLVQLNTNAQPAAPAVSLVCKWHAAALRASASTFRRLLGCLLACCALAAAQGKMCAWWPSASAR